MKRNLWSSGSLAIVSLIGSVALTGCAKTLHIRTVDADTGRPLLGVAATWTEDNHDLLLGSYHFGPTNLPVSSAGGLIEVPGLKSRYVSSFIFSCPGYSNTYGAYSGDDLTLSRGIESFSNFFILTGTLTIATVSNGCFIVEMKPIGR